MVGEKWRIWKISRWKMTNFSKIFPRRNFSPKKIFPNIFYPDNTRKAQNRFPEQKMLENDWMEIASTKVTSIWRRNNIEKSTSKTHQYFEDFGSKTHVEISTSNRFHNFHVDSSFKIDVISTNFPRGISTSNRWPINQDGFGR